ncbi:MAG TPA: SCO family protein [Myxococcota bacterium]|jgi:cytochrome oxidase Cu insertion factor (SCO1/SenC/PrrC family)|nr:SCO family protein [Myxococcota bacterium]
MSVARGATLAVAALCALAAAAAAHEGASPTRRFEPPLPGTYELPPLGHVGAHLLLASDGAAAPLLDLGPGEAALVAFVYLHCPDACPMANATFQRVDRAAAVRAELGARTRLVTVSLDPVRDPPAAMARLRSALAPRGRWSFLTAADAASLDPVLADFGQDVVRTADGAAVETHVLRVFLVDGAGRIRNVYSTGFLDERILVNDLLTVLAE